MRRTFKICSHEKCGHPDFEHTESKCLLCNEKHKFVPSVQRYNYIEGGYTSASPQKGVYEPSGFFPPKIVIDEDDEP